MGNYITTDATYIRICMHAVGAYDTCISIAKAMSGCGWDEVDRPLRLMRSLSVQNLQGDGEVCS